MTESDPQVSPEQDVPETGAPDVGSPETAGPTVAELQQKVAETNDKLLRTLAELENFRKRSQREADETRKYAAQNVLQELLPVMDNLVLAVQSGEKTRCYDEAQLVKLLEAAGAGNLPLADLLSAAGIEPSKTVVQGVRMVQQQLLNSLDRLHCKRIDTAGQLFDPNLHEVLTQMPSPEPSMTILQEIRPGFRYHERVIRAAQVIVSSGPPAAG